MQVNRYQDLRAWQRAIELVELVYTTISRLPHERTVWTEEPDAALFGFHSEQYRGGAGTRYTR